MRKKQLIFSALLIVLTLIIGVKNVDAKGNNENITCEYDYKNITLKYQIKSSEKLNLPFEDGVKLTEKEWYHGNDFDSIFLASTKTSENTIVCPTITVEENDSWITLFNNPRNVEDCNGTCQELVAQDNNVKTTKVFKSVANYNKDNYFLPYARILENGTKEWSVDGEKYYNINDKIVLENTTLKLSKELKEELFNNNKEIYRCVSLKNDKYTYELTTNKSLCKTQELSEKDNQATGSLSYHGAQGKPDDRETIDDLDDWGGLEGNQNCGSGGILGDPNDPDSVAWLLQQLLNYIRALGPMIVIVMSGIEYAKVIIFNDDDGLAKANKKLIQRLLLVAALFFIPTFVIALLDIFGMSNDPTCGLK